MRGVYTTMHVLALAYALLSTLAFLHLLQERSISGLGAGQVLLLIEHAAMVCTVIHACIEDWRRPR